MNGLDEGDRRVLVDLTGKLGDLLRKLEPNGEPEKASSGRVVHGNDDKTDEPSAFAFGNPCGQLANGTRQTPIRSSPTPLPDPRLLRRVISQRQLRAQVFPADLFSDPAWDILLDLAAAHAEHKRVSVTSLCIASGVPSTTALRWIRILTDAGLLERLEDTADKRRVFITLSDRGARLVARYFALLGPDLVSTL